METYLNLPDSSIVTGTKGACAFVGIIGDCTEADKESCSESMQWLGVVCCTVGILGFGS